VFELNELKITPVTGPPVWLPPADGMLTTNALAVPVPSYNVAVLVPLLPTQNGDWPKPLPQGFTRFLS
jgi:hypothetical protein